VQFEWTDKSNVDVQNWASNEPSQSEDPLTRICAAMDASGRWFDEECETKARFVCVKAKSMLAKCKFQVLPEESTVMNIFSFIEFTRLKLGSYDCDFGALRCSRRCAYVDWSAKAYSLFQASSQRRLERPFRVRHGRLRSLRTCFTNGFYLAATHSCSYKRKL